MHKLGNKTIYLLRHEKRPMNAGYQTELTDHGKLDAEMTLKPVLEGLKIDAVYSSPFVRTIQTIYPYCKANDIRVRCDNGLYEFLAVGYFTKTHTIDEIKDHNLKSIIDKKYKSCIPVTELKYESRSHMRKRIRKFLSEKLHPSSGAFGRVFTVAEDNILLVSHQSVVEEIISELFALYGREPIHINYPMGGLSRLTEDADGRLVFEMLN